MQYYKGLFTQDSGLTIYILPKIADVVVVEAAKNTLQVVSLIEKARLVDYCLWRTDLKNQRYSDEAKVNIYQLLPFKGESGLTGIILVPKKPPPPATNKTSISGYVRPILGGSLPEVELELLPVGMRTSTNNDGYYKFSDVPLPSDPTDDPYSLKPTELTITARKVTYNEFNKKIEVYSDVEKIEDITLTKNVSERGILKGLVLDANTRQPITLGPCLINIYNSDSQTFPYTYFTYDGNYSVNLEPGNYYIKASALSYKSTDVTGLIIKINETTDAPTIYLQPLSSKVPVAKFNMSSGGITGQENQGLNLAIVPSSMVLINFSAATSYDPDGDIVAYKWYINGTEVNINRDFSYSLSKGTYKVSLTVLDNAGTESTVSASINVTEYLPPSPEVKTETAVNITQTSAMLRGIVIPKGSDTTAWFEWGITIPYENKTLPISLAGR